jgi:threonine synthase
MSRFGLLCTRCSLTIPFRYNHMKCTCGGTLVVNYDLEQLKAAFTKQTVQARYPSMWRYKELLPLSKEDSIITLGEGWTPLVRLHEPEKHLPLQQLWVKREEQNPTGSFKARGFSVAVSLLHELGLMRPAVPSNGNAAGALAAYAGRAGMQAFAFIPKDCPPLIVQECVQYGATTFLVDGYIHDAAAIIEEGKKEQNWTHIGTLREHGRVEGKKTMGLELAEQLGWKLPSVIIYPTGGGSGIIGMWKAIQELQALGWVEGPLPRFVCVQEEGCQPIVDAVSAKPAIGSTVTSSPTGMRVPNPPDLELIVTIVKQSGGTSIAVSKDDIQLATRLYGSQGISASPEGAATWAGLIKLCDSGWVRPSDTVVLFNTSHAMKYASLEANQRPPTIRNYREFVGLKSTTG